MTATITDLSARRTQRAPACPPHPPGSDPEARSFLTLIYDSALMEGARRRDEEWIEFLGPLARNLNLAAFLASEPS